MFFSKVTQYGNHQQFGFKSFTSLISRHPTSSTTLIPSCLTISSWKETFYKKLGTNKKFSTTITRMPRHQEAKRPKSKFQPDETLKVIAAAMKMKTTDSTASSRRRSPRLGNTITTADETQVLAITTTSQKDGQQLAAISKFKRLKTFPANVSESNSNVSKRSTGDDGLEESGSTELCSKLLSYERKYWREGCKYVVGVDEAGRGPLAGPVVVAGCSLNEDCPDVDSSLINDSKKLSEEEREVVYAQLIKSKHVHYDIAIIDHQQIDDLNILKATLFGMDQVVTNLTKQKKCDAVLVDGPFKPPVAAKEQEKIEAIKGGDAKSRAIAAASVLAKVTRDRLMQEYHSKYPQYGFDRHKGYPVKDHVKALMQHGPCEIHRRSYAPVKQALLVVKTKAATNPSANDNST